MVITQKIFELHPYGMACVVILTCGLIGKKKKIGVQHALVDLRWNVPFSYKPFLSFANPQCTEGADYLMTIFYCLSKMVMHKHELY